MSKKVSFQGVEGAYSHLAVQEFFPNAEAVPCKTFELAITAAESGDVDYAMIPIENSAAGRVADIHRLLPKSDLHINFEHFQKVEHKLLIHPETHQGQIKKIISHEQALAQCSEKIQQLDYDILIGADTAGSAKYISEQKISDTAAIASSLAAKIYELKTVDESFANSSNNITRFYVMSKNENKDFDPDKTYISSFLFSVNNTPGSLFKVMGGFATNNVNMIKLESYNYGADFVITQFYCEIEGHPGQENTKFALDDMYHYCSKVRKLGVFEKSTYRSRQ
ncbi:MAG: prephenate dehydratase [Pelagibacteraceae bacterium]|jgi:prephenate dehydratase|nr:MAG: prephenate dehydratase [Pelagibacteraceae bacterium]|tara:strand:+ start:299 stop:1138 length:840 start_codon:yes stop_codon:yes gene_type:complete